VALADLLQHRGYRLLGDPGALAVDGEVDVAVQVEDEAGRRLWVLAEAKARLHRPDVRAWGRRLRDRAFWARLEAEGIAGPVLVWSAWAAVAFSLPLVVYSSQVYPEAMAALLVVYGVAFTATRVNLSIFDRELVFRGKAHAGLEQVLRNPRVEAGRRCGPVSVPNHKLIPDVRWILGPGAGVDDVVARSDARQARRIRRGVALYVTDRSALLRQALVERSDDPLDSVPMAGFTFVGASDYYGAYVSC
jgi:hypothetical protein